MVVKKEKPYKILSYYNKITTNIYKLFNSDSNRSLKAFKPVWKPRLCELHIVLDWN